MAERGAGMEMKAASPEAARGRAGRALAYGALALAGSLWGTGFVFGKVALREMGVGHMVLYRFLAADVGLVPIALMHRIRLGRREMATVAVAAVLGVPVQFLLQFAGLARTSVAHASLIVGALPMLLAVGAVAFGRERLRPLGWAALVASTVGAALIAAAGGSSPGTSMAGDLLVLASLFAAAVFLLLCKRLMERYPPPVVTAYVLLAGTVPLAAYVLAVDGPPPIHLSPKTWLSLLAMGLAATALTTVLWNWGMARVPASIGGVFLNLEPVVGAILGVALLGDTLGPFALLGGVLIVGAAVVLTRAGEAA